MSDKGKQFLEAAKADFQAKKRLNPKLLSFSEVCDIFLKSEKDLTEEERDFLNQNKDRFLNSIEPLSKQNAQIKKIESWAKQWQLRRELRETRLLKYVHDIEPNPLFQIYTYKKYKEVGKPPPTWALEYFDTISDRLLELVENPAVTPTMIKNAVGIKDRRLLRGLTKTLKKLKIAESIFELQVLEKKSWSDATQIVKNEHCISMELAREYYYWGLKFLVKEVST